MTQPYEEIDPQPNAKYTPLPDEKEVFEALIRRNHAGRDPFQYPTCPPEIGLACLLRPEKP